MTVIDKASAMTNTLRQVDNYGNDRESELSFRRDALGGYAVMELHIGSNVLVYIDNEGRMDPSCLCFVEYCLNLLVSNKSLVHSGEWMTRRVGDVATNVRYGFNALITRIKSERFVGVLDWNEIDPFWKQARERIGFERFGSQKSEIMNLPSFDDTIGWNEDKNDLLAAMAKHERFDGPLFSRRFLRKFRPQKDDCASDATDDGYLHLYDTWVQEFVAVIQQADEMIQVQRALEAYLGDVQDRFLDPLLRTLMTDPVRLPSGNVVARAILALLLAALQQGGEMVRYP
ncbi:hypothetical protein CCR75_009431 [Bremia lactucae]|uniref:U-box domain-containing protein n=1 Tax=Bremia lactucae TaxID=4779 RepID=A0A976IBU6_BRELC|nr:hypothetical protein CCR75_009431 [Bremia lactucae]